MSTATPPATKRAGASSVAGAAYAVALVLPVCILLQRQDWVLPHTGLGVGIGTLCGVALLVPTVVSFANGTHPSVVRGGPVPFLLLCWTITVLASYTSWAVSGMRSAALLADVALVQLLLEAIFVLGLMGALGHEERVWSFLKVLTACGGLYGLLLIVTSVLGTEVAQTLRLPVLEVQSAIDGIEASRGGFIRTQGMAEHPLEAGAVAAILVPTALGLTRGLAARHRPWKLWAAFTLCEFLGALSTLSRSATVAIAVALLVMALRWSARTIGSVAAAIVVATGAMAVSAPEKFAAYLRLFGTTAGGDSSLYSRAQAREHVFVVLQHSFWTGEGMGTQDALGRPTLDNQILGIAVELGVPATLAFVALFVGSIVYLLHRAGRLPTPRRELAIGVAGSLASTVVIYAILDALAFHQIRLLTFVLLALVGPIAAVRSPTSARGGEREPVVANPSTDRR